MKNIALAVTTYNRLSYLKSFIESWIKYRSRYFNWYLIISDDGSSDGTLEYIMELQKHLKNIFILQHQRQGVHTGTNSIFRLSLELEIDFGFKADDDIFFIKEGWDSEYINAAMASGYQHLCYYNTTWKKGSLPYPVYRAPLQSYTDVLNCFGCFWTFTPEMLGKIGGFDVDSFGFRGYGHIDFSMRACRAGFNIQENLFDILNSEHYIDMQPRHNYIRSISDQELKAYSTDEVKAQKTSVINNTHRLYIPSI